jgi:hypothetical protein
MTLNNVVLLLFVTVTGVAQSYTSCGADLSAWVVVEGKQTPTTKIAIDRLREHGGLQVEVAADGKGSESSKPKLTVRLSTDQPAGKPDSYLLKTVSKDPHVISVSGNNQRGMLYAAYHLADLVKAGADLSSLNILRQPKIAERYATFGATSHARVNYDPELHWRTLNEAPGFGYNGIIIYPNAGTPLGRRSSPVMEKKNGDLYLDPENTARWHGWFARLKEYQLDIMMTVPPAIPPGFTDREIRTYYQGGPEPKNYIPALQAHFRKLLEFLTATYPEVDRFMFNTTEGATFGRNERFFVHPDLKRFTNETYLQNNEKVMRSYMDVLREFFGQDLDRVAFWTHSFGITSHGIELMRKVLFDYPQVMIIEDDFWNNNLWPMDLPAMAYLPTDLRAQVSKKNPFALYQIATDGEYYGGGSLPNAYPGSHIRTAREAVDRNARMVIHRLDLHCQTPYGTALGPMKILPYAAAKQVWEPTPSEEEIWQEWAVTRFGKDAAPFVISALKESHSVLIDGLSCNGIDLLAVGSQFNTRLWTHDGSGLTRFYLFGKPGRRFVDKQKGEPVFSGEYTSYQMNTRSIPMSEFRQNQEKARAAVTRGLDQIGEAKPHLTPADYDTLRGIFLDGAIVLKAMRLLGECAYAANLRLDNFDNVVDPKAMFDHAAADLESFLAERQLKPEMTENITKILASYKSIRSP